MASNVNIDMSSAVIKPLHSLEEIEAWEPTDHDSCRASVPLSNHNTILPGRPRTLFCHDLKGGYLDDRFVDGVSNNDGYRFYHWQHIDIFNYFSHNTVTIPPPCWTNAAHKHGTLVMGTFITEWDDGKEKCAKILESNESCDKMVKKLVDIAVFYKFDGWLINIENKIEEEKIPMLVRFTKCLTDEMHSAIPYSQVLWYDSVIKTGELKWQNEVSQLNREFFDVSDGIFLNYCWKDNNLPNSARLCQEAGRPYDVYVGVDVFGRGCLGGGGFNTKLAVSEARKHNLSVAMFAPSWTYEKLGQAEFNQNEKRFWEELNDLCPLRTTKSSLPFYTNFCQGYGLKTYNKGKISKTSPWTNLSEQSLQPTHSSVQFIDNDTQGCTMSSYIDEAYQGGGCLLMCSTTDQESKFRLFSCDICVEKTTKLHVSFAYKVLSPHPTAVTLKLVIGHDESTQSYLIGQHEPSKDNNSIDNEAKRPDCDIHSTDTGWDICSTEIEVRENSRITEIDCVLDGTSRVLLGELNIL